MTILGYNIDDWNRIYQLYKHTKKDEPKDLSALRIFWMNETVCKAPSDYIDIALRLIQCSDIEVTPVHLMLEKLVYEMK